MAINPNFVFSDPALQAQVVAAQRVQAEAEAERGRQMAATLAELSRQRREREDREQRRADILRQEARADTQSAEQRRQFNEDLKLREKTLEANERVATGKNAKTEENDLYRRVLSLIESNDPPTTKELEAKMVGLSDSLKQGLRDRRTQVIGILKGQAKNAQDMADYQNGLIGNPNNLNPKTQKPYTVDEIFRPLMKGGQFRIKADGTGIEPVYLGPREDEVPGSGAKKPGRVTLPGAEGLGGMELGESDEELAAPGRIFVGGPPNGVAAVGTGNESIQDVLARKTPPDRMDWGGFFGPSTLNTARFLLRQRMPMPGSFMVRPTILSPSPIVDQPSIGFVPRDTDFRVPVAYPGGPPLVAPSPEEEDFLAPPVFAPAY